MTEMQAMPHRDAIRELERAASRPEADPLLRRAIETAVEALDNPLKAFARREVPSWVARHGDLPDDKIQAASDIVIERLDDIEYEPILDPDRFRSWIIGQLDDLDMEGDAKN